MRHPLKLVLPPHFSLPRLQIQIIGVTSQPLGDGVSSGPWSWQVRDCDLAFAAESAVIGCGALDPAQERQRNQMDASQIIAAQSVSQCRCVASLMKTLTNNRFNPLFAASSPKRCVAPLVTSQRAEFPEGPSSSGHLLKAEATEGRKRL